VCALFAERADVGK